jgi:hypothetical protein
MVYNPIELKMKIFFKCLFSLPRNMTKAICFLVRSPSGNMARKQYSLKIGKIGTFRQSRHANLRQWI